MTAVSPVSGPTGATGALEPITRPNGTVYRPRKIVALGVNDYDEDLGGVVVFGTHDVQRAQSLADNYVGWAADSRCVAARPSLVWWLDGFEAGHRTFISDPEHGRAAVYFSAIEERPNV